MLNSYKKRHIPVQFIKTSHSPNGNFPNGVPNPLILENREITSKAVKEYGADMGIAWDGDFDRCFFFDENGKFVESHYIAGLISEILLKKNEKEKVVHDTRLTWNIKNIVQKNNGIPIESKPGHVFIKECMRKENAIYGSEMSGHHYFRDFQYCDSGMIPWLLLLEYVSELNEKLSTLVSDMINNYPCSGEINYEVDDVVLSIEKVKKYFENTAVNIEFVDGLTMEFSDWRFNLRASDTEPLLRLNIESFKNRKKINDTISKIEKILNQ